MLRVISIEFSSIIAFIIVVPFSWVVFAGVTTGTMIGEATWVAHGYVLIASRISAINHAFTGLFTDVTSVDDGRVNFIDRNA